MFFVVDCVVYDVCVDIVDWFWWEMVEWVVYDWVVCLCVVEVEY